MSKKYEIVTPQEKLDRDAVTLQFLLINGTQKSIEARSLQAELAEVIETLDPLSKTIDATLKAYRKNHYELRAAGDQLTALLSPYVGRLTVSVIGEDNETVIRGGVATSIDLAAARIALQTDSGDIVEIPYADVKPSAVYSASSVVPCASFEFPGRILSDYHPVMAPLDLDVI